MSCCCLLFLVVCLVGWLAPRSELTISTWGFCRAPTLSYTKQLESRVAQLEDALSKLRGQQVDVEARKGSSPASVAESSSSAGRRIKTEHDEGLDLAREFDGLNVENDGRISFHGPTSLFQLPSGVVNETASTSHFAQELEARKERLINSAWRERAFEQMAAMPVRPDCLNPCENQS